MWEVEGHLARQQQHVPVMSTCIVHALALAESGVYVDATFGCGGHTRALLHLDPNNRVVALDRDSQAVALGRRLAEDYSGRLIMLEGCFSELEVLLEEQGIRLIDGIVFDLGVSSVQLEQGHRGFSFMRDGPLDMRMSPERQAQTAADLLEQLSETELVQMLKCYGEERYASRIARAIVRRRERQPITRTGHLVELIRTVGGGGSHRIDPATRTFQALRIKVNDEIKELQLGLIAAQHLLGKGGRLAVMSFHSLEDRTVKEFLQPVKRGISRHRPWSEAAESSSSWRLLTKKPLRPSLDEIEDNSRARSAKLRVAERLANW